MDYEIIDTNFNLDIHTMIKSVDDKCINYGKSGHFIKGSQLFIFFNN